MVLIKKIKIFSTDIRTLRELNKEITDVKIKLNEVISTINELFKNA